MIVMCSGKNTAKQWQNDDKDFLIQRSPKTVASFLLPKFVRSW